MNREQKEVVVQSLRDSFSQSEAAFLVKYRGLTVNQMQELRRRLREHSGRIKVAKARLMKRAVHGLDSVQELDTFFKDQVGLVFADQDASLVAKALHEFAKENGSLELVAGYFDERVLASEDVARIATLPSREVLLAQVAATLKAPIAGLARALHMVPARLVWGLKKVEEKKQ